MFFRVFILLFSVGVTGTMIYVNAISDNTGGFNTVSKYVLDNAPELYSPHIGVFVEKLGGTSHSDIELIVNPIAYSGYMYTSTGVNDAGFVRKLLVYGTDDEVDRVRALLKTDEESESTLDELFEDVPRDERLHYVTISTSMEVTIA